VIAAKTGVATAEVDAVNAPEDMPAVTVMLEGTEAEGEALARVMAVPPVGAGPDRVIVQVLGEPPMTLAGVQLIDESAGD